MQCFAHAGSLQLRSVQLPRLTTPEERQRPLLRQKAPEPQQALSAALALQGTSVVSVLPSGNQQLRCAALLAMSEARRRRKVLAKGAMLGVKQVDDVVKEEAVVGSRMSRAQSLLKRTKEGSSRRRQGKKGMRGRRE